MNGCSYKKLAKQAICNVNDIKIFHIMYNKCNTSTCFDHVHQKCLPSFFKYKFYPICIKFAHNSIPSSFNFYLKTIPHIFKPSYKIFNLSISKKGILKIYN